MKKSILLINFVFFSLLSFSQIRVDVGYNYSIQTNGFNVGVVYSWKYYNAIGLGIEVYSPTYKPFFKASFERSFTKWRTFRPTIRLDYLIKSDFETQLLRPSLGVKTALPFDAANIRIFEILPFYAQNIELKGKSPHGVHIFGIQITYFQKLMDNK